MFQTMVRAVGLTACVLFLANSAMAQGKPAAPAAKKGTAYDVQFAFGDTTYSGKMTLAVVKGTVSGSMAIDTPTTVTGRWPGRSATPNWPSTIPTRWPAKTPARAASSCRRRWMPRMVARRGRLIRADAASWWTARLRSNAPRRNKRPARVRQDGLTRK